jgi:hypothetical protein
MILQDGFERTHIRCYEDEKTKKPLAKPAGVKFLVRADSRPLHAAILFLAAEQPVRGATQGCQRHRAGFDEYHAPA